MGGIILIDPPHSYLMVFNNRKPPLFSQKVEYSSLLPLAYQRVGRVNLCITLGSTAYLPVYTILPGHFFFVVCYLCRCRQEFYSSLR
ncbi:hypothetical protein DM02DRAFT_130803 [Periconia macrospinosa]|uniref:Uncharacterized protein n=1 Tax=Periconia macrospinosa TaxID=97972 RepID=A0A2V1DDD9_9PLEO|nr:hypothetical protein DM02DRAFT_130803 [Periconia macrospinosa]